MMKMRIHAAQCTEKQATAQQAEYIRHIFQHVHQVIGCLIYVKISSAADLNVERWKERNIKTWYYTTNLHSGAFMLRYVEDMLEEEGKLIQNRRTKRWEDF